VEMLEPSARNVLIAFLDSRKVMLQQNGSGKASGKAAMAKCT